MAFDVNGYPTERTLDNIETCTFHESPEQLAQFIDYIRAHWRYADAGYFLYEPATGRLELHTAGWSGNEDIIVALQQSLFFSFYWQRSYRGGHYYFQLPAQPEQKTKYGPLDYNDGGRWTGLRVEEFPENQCIEIEEIILDEGLLDAFITVPNCKVLPLASELLRVSENIKPCEKCKYEEADDV